MSFGKFSIYNHPVKSNLQNDIRINMDRKGKKGLIRFSVVYNKLKKWSCNLFIPANEKNAEFDFCFINACFYAFFWFCCPINSRFGVFFLVVLMSPQRAFGVYFLVVLFAQCSPFVYRSFVSDTVLFLHHWVLKSSLHSSRWGSLIKLKLH